MKHIFIIGSKGIPAAYGGFESFVEQLTRSRVSEEIKYHVACQGAETKEYQYQNAHCFQLKVPKIGPAKAVYYDIMAFRYCLNYIKANQIQSPIIYILACRIGPFIHALNRRLKKSSGKIFINPDGHEWMRAKWNAAIRRYWKFSERLMVKNADEVICDSKNMQTYIKDEYRGDSPSTHFIAYGAKISKSKLSDEGAQKNWYQKFGILPGEFYLVVGRFVPENNYETMIREFMSSDSTKKLVLISNVDSNKFYYALQKRTGFDADDRICFAGTVYDEELLKKIREDAFAYLHGHEVGGTNPSLLEALSCSELNLLLDVGFNREVGEDGALYWTKEAGDLKRLMTQAEQLSAEQREVLGEKAKARIREHYSQERITKAYEDIFLS
ncbi:MAG: beta 1-4 rhamnosyltransferase Cps2T [Lachnospiraceae bacterium]